MRGQTRSVQLNPILTIPFRRDIIHRPILQLQENCVLLVHAAINLMHGQNFCHKVSLTNFRVPIFGPMTWIASRHVSVGGIKRAIKV